VGLAAEVFALPVRGEQAGRAPEEVVAIARSLGLKAESCAGAEEALRALARHDSPPPRILIAGSLYLVGEILAANGTPPE
jgi:dihydrofolate synthase / folylpolyglutamate synthase